MSYLTSYATRRLQLAAAEAPGIRIDEENLLNLPGHHAGAFIRSFVEDTTGRRWRKRPPHPTIRLWIADCSNKISLWFEVDSPERRENALHKADTLIETLVRFRAALDAECELYEHRAVHGRHRTAHGPDRDGSQVEHPAHAGGRGFDSRPAHSAGG